MCVFTRSAHRHFCIVYDDNDEAVTVLTVLTFNREQEVSHACESDRIFERHIWNEKWAACSNYMRSIRIVGEKREAPPVPLETNWNRMRLPHRSATNAVNSATEREQTLIGQKAQRLEKICPFASRHECCMIGDIQYKSPVTRWMHSGYAGINYVSLQLAFLLSCDQLTSTNLLRYGNHIFLFFCRFESLHKNEPKLPNTWSKWKPNIRTYVRKTSLWPYKANPKHTILENIHTTADVAADLLHLCIQFGNLPLCVRIYFNELAHNSRRWFLHLSQIRSPPPFHPNSMFPFKFYVLYSSRRLESISREKKNRFFLLLFNAKKLKSAQQL